MVAEAEAIVEEVMADAQQIEPIEPPQIGHVTGGAGAEVSLAGVPFHFKRFTAAGMRDLGKWLDSPDGRLLPVYAEGLTYGGMIAEAVGAGGNEALKRIQSLMRMTLAERVADDLAEGCEVDELADFIDALFAHSGLRWLERILKNSAERQAEKQLGLMLKQMDAQMDAAMRQYENAATGTEKPATSSTNS